jgi:hypothetical protein
MKDPISFFFSLGDKVTKGNPQRKADFDYYMLWIIFIAFVTVLVSYIRSFIMTLDFGKLGWGVVIFGILWFQYFTLKGAREARKYIKSIPQTPKNEEKDEKIEDVDEMVESFKEKLPKIIKDKKSRVRI